MIKKVIVIIAVVLTLLLLGIGGWFVWNQVNMTPNDRMCYLDERVRQESFTGTITEVLSLNYTFPVGFELTSGTTYSLTRIQVGALKNNLSIGDRVLKSLGDLKLTINHTNGDSSVVDLSHGCVLNPGNPPLRR